ncbi:hypothetical protein PS664_04924 [Pseudomonas fluorescens]|nr:hypothetical protein PS664_04924 [Pseudomonas fluorescens]
MLNKDQNQDVGAGALAIQAARDVIIGISASDARAIALDVAKVTFYELTGLAKETMSARVEEITDSVISKLERDYPDGLKKAVDPDFQYALLTVQKQYGRTGDKELADLLVDLLVDRSKQDQRNILQIVLNESLEVAPKLTTGQLATLSLVFLFRHTANHSVLNDQMFGTYLDAHVQPFVQNLVKNQASFQHLEFTGCGSNVFADVPLGEVLTTNYPGLFSKGFDSAVYEEMGLSAKLRASFLLACFNDKTKFQVSALNDSGLEELFLQNNVLPSDREKIKRLYELNRMSSEDAKIKCISLRPYMVEVFTMWEVSPAKSFSLTSVGIAIAHANINRFVDNGFSDLSIWIN